jgi:ribosomal protein L4
MSRKYYAVVVPRGLKPIPIGGAGSNAKRRRGMWQVLKILLDRERSFAHSTPTSSRAGGAERWAWN